jgi:phosphopantothenoylcysteine decarboxylase / phosphopantothenate---cysteine ligase
MIPTQLPQNFLENQKIVIAISGSIAVYKICELIRYFTKSGAQIRIVMSASAAKFVTPLTFEVLSGNKVLDDTNEDWSNDFNHIGFATWADLLIIAPATANTINKLSHGVADNLITQVALACNKPKLLAPAANTAMIESQITLASIKQLKLNAYEVIESRYAELACKTEGNGALATPEDIYHQAVRLLFKDNFYQNRNITISGGGTIEKIDDVRYLSNFSSGKMARSIALISHLCGANVTLVSTKFDETLPLVIKQYVTPSTQEMQNVLNDVIRKSHENKDLKQIQKSPLFFSAAAVSDYIPSEQVKGKLKKESLGNTWELHLTKNQDILNNIDKDKLITIGFKAEFDSENALKNAKNMLNNKELSAVALNILGGEINFGSDQSQMTFLTKDQSIQIKKAPKIMIAHTLLHHIKVLFS